jgi:hypothetical protein
MNVETGLMQYTKSDGILHVRSVSDLRIVEAKVNEISIPYNFSRIGSERRKAGDLGIRVEYFDKSVKLLNTTAELVAKDIYWLLQCIEKLPENPLTRDNLIFKHSRDYRNRLIDYLNFINHKDEFSIFKGALAVELHKNEKTPSGTPTSIIEIVTNNDFGDRQASVEAILNTPSYSLQSFLSVNKGERISMLKAAINSLSAHVWHSINSLIKDSISQEVARRYQLRFLVSMVQSYRTLELLCALKPRKQGQTIKSQVTKKILKRSDGRLNEKDLTLNLQRGFRIERVLNAIRTKWNVLDAIDTLTPCFFTSTINGCTNFEIWLEIVVSNEIISYNEADNRYKQFKMSSAYDRVQSIKQACENNGVEIQQPNEMDFSFDRIPLTSNKGLLTKFQIY